MVVPTRPFRSVTIAVRRQSSKALHTRPVLVFHAIKIFVIHDFKILFIKIDFDADNIFSCSTVVVFGVKNKKIKNVYFAITSLSVNLLTYNGVYYYESEIDLLGMSFGVMVSRIADHLSGQRKQFVSSSQQDRH